ncbi:MAG: glycine cleavage system protein GcvH [Candidatus Aminicenantes bacterium]|nr:glycine cleavage system protein GcvH [Candidatus Aminicenantes bacterium]
MYPEEYRYSKDHEWIKVEGDLGTIGITDFAQKQMGDVVYVEMPDIGTELECHQTIGVIESVKAVSDIYSPTAGEVLEVNENLNESPELINEDPHGKGWIIKIKIKKSSEVEKMMSFSDYEKFLSGLDE